MLSQYTRRVPETTWKSPWRIDFERKMAEEKNRQVIHRIVASPSSDSGASPKTVVPPRPKSAQVATTRPGPKPLLVVRTKFCSYETNGVACGKPLNASNAHGLCGTHYHKDRYNLAHGARPTCVDCGQVIYRGNIYDRCRKHSKKFHLAKFKWTQKNQSVTLEHP